MNWRKLFAGVALVTSTTLVVSACQVSGTAEPNAAAVASMAASSAAPATSSSTPATGSGRESPAEVSTIGKTAASATAPSPRTGTAATSGTIEDHSTSELPSTPGDPASTSPGAGPTITMADDGYPVSVMVTTIWARALVAKGVKVGIRTIGTTAIQVSALKSGQVDLVQQYNSGLLRYLDKESKAVSRAEVDAAIGRDAPTGLAALDSSPATDDAQLTASAATASKFGLHSISDLSGHLKDVTLLLPDDSTASTFTRQLSSYYGLTFPVTKRTDFAGTKTIAAIRSTAAVGLMVASQFQIDDNKFVALTDPEHFFSTENFIPLVSKTVTPAMRSLLNAVSAKLTVHALRGLRKRVAQGGGSYPEVADDWLASVGMK